MPPLTVAELRNSLLDFRDDDIVKVSYGVWAKPYGATVIADVEMIDRYGMSNSFELTMPLLRIEQ